jgi:hypothetical protein
VAVIPKLVLPAGHTVLFAGCVLIVGAAQKVNVAALVVAVGVQAPLIKQRYLYPEKLEGILVMFMVAAVTLLYDPALARLL